MSDTLESLRAALDEVTKERDEARSIIGTDEPIGWCIARLKREVETAKKAIIEGFYSETDQAGALVRASLYEAVKHAVDHHYWHHTDDRPRLRDLHENRKAAERERDRLAADLATAHLEVLRLGQRIAVDGAKMFQLTELLKRARAALPIVSGVGAEIDRVLKGDK